MATTISLPLARTITLKDPLPGRAGPITELTIRPVDKRASRGRPFGMDKGLWRISKMTGVETRALAYLGEADAETLLAAMAAISVDLDHALAALDAQAAPALVLRQ